ncbi:MAG: hypothetical protein JXR70_15240 [Spirochaetales bacterium]|nr:hypothetical protein [Spirochaetales bacterium]
MLKALGIGAMVYHFFKNGTPKHFPLDNFQAGCMYKVNANEHSRYKVNTNEHSRHKVNANKQSR